MLLGSGFSGAPITVTAGGVGAVETHVEEGILVCATFDPNAFLSPGPTAVVIQQGSATASLSVIVRPPVSIVGEALQDGFDRVEEIRKGARRVIFEIAAHVGGGRFLELAESNASSAQLRDEEHRLRRVIRTAVHCSFQALDEAKTETLERMAALGASAEQLEAGQQELDSLLDSVNDGLGQFGGAATRSVGLERRLAALRTDPPTRARQKAIERLQEHVAETTAAINARTDISDAVKSNLVAFVSDELAGAITAVANPGLTPTAMEVVRVSVFYPSALALFAAAPGGRTTITTTVTGSTSGTGNFHELAAGVVSSDIKIRLDVSPPAGRSVDQITTRVPPESVQVRPAGGGSWQHVDHSVTNQDNSGGVASRTIQMNLVTTPVAPTPCVLFRAEVVVMWDGDYDHEKIVFVHIVP